MSEPLRKCTVCGLEAHSEEDLLLFVKNYKQKNGRGNKCKKCDAKATYIRMYPDRDVEAYVLRKEEKSKYLRKCRVCGLEAHSTEDLEYFLSDSTANYNKANLCIQCYRKKDKEYRDNPINWERLRERQRRYYKTDKGKRTARKQNRIRKLRTRTQSFNQDVSNIYEIVNALNNIGDIKYEVDRIYPLTHSAMCGLHNIANLQILESDINNRKNNRLGYLYQLNCSDLALSVSPKASRESIFNKLGSNLTYEQFLQYEEENYKEYIYNG